MIEQYDVTTIEGRRLALREISQEVVLCGLSRAGFFKEAAFYGGTALRIFHGLDRFSEDMDFSLQSPNPQFNLEFYLSSVEKECADWGLNFSASVKHKTRESAIQSAFLKANTLEHVLTLFPKEGAAETIPSGELLRIKVEIDTDPAPFAAFERQYRLLPAPYEACLYDEPSLFAGKIHAVICRSWKNRVKGRDLYDFVFYLARNVRVNLPHLEAKLRQTGRIGPNDTASIEDVRAMLCERFDAIDFEQAKNDVAPFLQDRRSFDVWSADFFKSITQGLDQA
jgi:predicted nucleotidyltransferase component of viral defense system